MGRLVNTADINNVLMSEKSNYGVFAVEIDHIISGIVSKCPTIEQEPKTDTLGKIRAEIDEQYDRVHPYNISCAEGLEMALEIIDKYKGESEIKK